MANNPAKDFNKIKYHLFSVGVAPKEKREGRGRRPDHTSKVDDAIHRIKSLAIVHGFKNIELKKDGGSFDKLGIFFMTAPEKFASIVKQLDGIYYVDKPAGKTNTKKSIPSGLRRGKK